MAHTTIPIAPLSADFRRGLQDLLDREDLSWIQNCAASDLDKALLAYRDAVVTMGLARFARELRELDERLVARGVPCPVCGQLMTENRGENHEWETPVGVFDLRRTYLECREHKVRYFPLDAHLKLPVVGRATPMWGNALSQLGVELPYEPGQRLLNALTQRNISAKTIDAQVQRDGRTLHDIELEEAKRLWPYDEKGYARVVEPEVIRAVVEGAIFRAPTTGSALVLQGDGAMINLAADEEIKKEREKERRKRRIKGSQTAAESESDPAEEQEGSPFRESIQLLIYRLDDVVRKRRGKYGKRKKRAGQYRRDRTIITNKQTACVVNNPLLVGMQMNRLAHLWGFQRYSARVFVADGSEKLWELAKAYFQFTVGILDINHARAHIRDCGNALYRDDPKKARAWGQCWAKRILKEGAGPLLAHLKELNQATWDSEPARLLKNLIVYVEEHQEHMKYPDFLAKGYPIASGAIEGANKHILISRCRRAGQQFKKANAQHLLALRTALLDNRWDQAMERVRQSQAYPAQPVAPARIVADAPKKAGSKATAPPKPPWDGRGPVMPLEAPRRKLPEDELSLQAEIRRTEIRRIQANLAAKRGLRPSAHGRATAQP
jgi:hypothetical protein